jgi:hypothetical protein
MPIADFNCVLCSAYFPTFSKGHTAYLHWLGQADCYRICSLCFVMLSQFILSLPKGSIAVVTVLTFCILHLIVVIPPFALMQKAEPKNQGKPKWLRLFCRPTHNSSHYNIHLFLTSFQAACLITTRNFFKTLCFSFQVQQTIGAVSRFPFPKEQSFTKYMRDKALYLLAS